MEGADDTCGVTAAGIVVNYASLFVTCIASYRIALFVAPLSIGPISIPRGTGFMLVGMLAAGLRPRMIKCAGATYPVWGGGTADTVDDVELNVYFPINYVCMCFIAYATGSELIVRRYRKLYKKILKVTLMVILSVFLCVSFPLFLLLDAPTSRDAVFDAGDAKLPAMSAPSLRWAVALLFGSILVSRSPASAISIVGEMRANGDYTQSALGVTICMYVGVNVVFAICQAVSIILLSGQETLTDSLANGTALGDAAASASANATGAGDGEGTDAEGGVLIFAAVLPSLFVSIVLLEVRRANAAVVARGFTKLMIDDELTLCGRPQSLSEVTAIKKGRVVLMLGATDSSFLKSGRLTGRLGSVSARPAQGVPRSSYKYPDQTSVVFRVNVFDAEALHESEQKARDRMSRATHRMSRDSGAGMRDSRATGQD